MDPANRHVIRRFLCKTAILTVFAVAQWRHGVAATLGLLFGMASMIDIALALFGKASIQQFRLSYWDEAVAFLLMSSLATVIAKA